MEHPIDPIRRDVACYVSTGFLFLTFLCACSPSPGNFHSLANTQPYVLSISPEPYHVIDKLEGVEITFSHPVDPNTVSDKTVYVASGEIDKKDVKKEEIPKVSGHFETSSDLQTLRWYSQENLNPGDYSLVVTSGLQATNHSPFNQNPGQDPEAFVAVFHVSGTPSNNSTSSLPTSDSPSLSLHRPSFLVINEILYDAAGSDTDGNEFIELYGTAETDIDRYQIVIINGSDGEIIDTLTLPEGSKIPEDGIFLIADSRTSASRLSNISNSDFIDNFDPQNGPDALQLLDHQGRLLDTLCYGEGNLPLARNGLETCEASAATDVSSGHSLSRMNSIDTDSNADDFIDLAVPTPGIL